MLLTTGQGVGPQFKTQTSTVNLPELDITGMTYQSVTIDITASNTRGFCINSDGTKLYVVQNTDNIIEEYALGTPNDITTLTATGNTLDVSSLYTALYDCCLSDDDSKIYIIGTTYDKIRQYDMSTPSDLSSATYSGNEFNTLLAQPKGVSLVDGGTKMFVTDETDDTIHRYDLSTAYDISSASHAQQSSPIARGFPLYVNEAGTKILVNSFSLDLVYQYALSTPYDLSTLSEDTTVDTSSGPAEAWSSAPSSDNNKLFVSGRDGDFYEFG